MVDPSILQLNNHAVALMLAGHESTAHATLQTAFSQLKAEVGSPQPCEHAAPEVRSSPRSVPAKNCSHVAIETTEEPKPQMAPSSMMEVDASQTSNPIYCTAQELDGMKDLEFVLNSQPLLFDESCQQDLPFDVCVSAILFNLALLFHHAALRTRRSSRQRSTSNHPRVHSSRTTSTTATARNNANSNNQGKSAMEMQRVTTSMAYSLYATSRNFARSSFCTSSVLPAATVLIASSNNLACLQCDLGQSDQADETFAETVRSLRCSNSGVLSQALGNELGNIFLNRMTWKNVIVASAA